MIKDRDIPQRYQIARTTTWSVSHRINSALPGYLMISSTIATNDLSDLSAEALGSMGIVLATVQHALNALGAQRVYLGR